MTISGLITRIESVCTGLGFTRATGALEQEPVGVTGALFDVAAELDSAQSMVGGVEEWRVPVTVGLRRPANADINASAARVLDDVSALLVGVVNDSRANGSYCVEDVGRSVRIEAPRGSSVVLGTLRFTANIEAAL